MLKRKTAINRILSIALALIMVFLISAPSFAQANDFILETEHIINAVDNGIIVEEQNVSEPEESASAFDSSDYEADIEIMQNTVELAVLDISFNFATFRFLAPIADFEEAVALLPQYVSIETNPPTLRDPLPVIWAEIPILPPFSTLPDEINIIGWSVDLPNDITNPTAIETWGTAMVIIFETELEIERSVAIMEINMLPLSNALTAEEVISAVESAIDPAITVTWHVDFELTPSTTTARGSITGTLRLTLGTEYVDILIDKTFPHANPIVGIEPRVRGAINSIHASNFTTEEDFISVAESAIAHSPIIGIEVTCIDFKLTPSNLKETGTVTGIIRLTYDGENLDIPFNRTIHILFPLDFRIVWGVENAINSLHVSNATTLADFVAALKDAIRPDVEFLWNDDFSLTPATDKSTGVITVSGAVTREKERIPFTINRPIPRTRTATEMFLEWDYGRLAAPRTNNHWPATFSADDTLLSNTNLEFYYADGVRAILGRTANDRLAINVPNRGSGTANKFPDWYIPHSNDEDAPPSFTPNTTGGWVITFSTIGWENINLSAKQSSSNNGPGEFALAYRIGTEGEWISYGGALPWVSSRVSVRNDVSHSSASGTTFENFPLPDGIGNQPVVQVKLYVSIGDVRLGGTSTYGLPHDEGNTSINNIVFKGERIQMLDDAQAAAQTAVDTLLILNGTTAEEFTNAVQTAIAPFTTMGTITVSWHDEFTLTPSTDTETGLITGTIRLTRGTEYADVTVNRIIETTSNLHRQVLQGMRLVVENLMQSLPVSNATTVTDIVSSIDAIIFPTINVLWLGDFNLIPANTIAPGKISGTIRLTMDSDYVDIDIDIVIPKIDMEYFRTKAQQAADSMSVSNETTATDFTSAIETAIAGAGINIDVSWHEEFSLIPAKERSEGKITGVIRLTVEAVHYDIIINREIRRTRIATEKFLEWDYGRFAAPQPNNIWRATFGEERQNSNLAFYYIDGIQATLGRAQHDRLAINAPNRSSGHMQGPGSEFGDWWSYLWFEESPPKFPTADEAAGWVITLSTIGWENINFTASQASSNNGPGKFDLAYRIGTEGEFIPCGDNSWNMVSVRTNALSPGITFENVQLPDAIANQPVVQIKMYISTPEVRIGGTIIHIDPTEGNTSINNIVFKGERINENCEHCEDSGDCCEHCNPCDCPELVTVSFDLGDGSFTTTPPALTLTSGSTVGILPRMTEMSNPGYRFAGWFEDTDDESTRWRDNNQVDSDILLRAKWMPIPNPSNFRIGDVNNDGRVTSADATVIARHLISHNVDFCSLSADMNGDGEVGVDDITLLARWLVGLNVAHFIAH